ncbi:hypothetical protein B0T21DRAFT_396035 [Apiosordaria backusii]|uniref:Uncharacterized protein n=1 Tax=Apiosordaria backusii TaxID=314023 RepID=A0AA40AID8_9PEZI|nr:hypothetical protein B0T21DRAFT_396035 [Apiosordaria backusii]
MPKSPRKHTTGSPSPYARPSSTNNEQLDIEEAARALLATTEGIKYYPLRDTDELPPKFNDSWARNIAVLLTKAENDSLGSQRIYPAIQERARIALNEKDAYRWVVYKTPELDKRYFFADEHSGRTMEDTIYRAFTNRFRDEVQKIHHKRKMIADKVDAKGAFALAQIEKMLSTLAAESKENVAKAMERNIENLKGLRLQEYKLDDKSASRLEIQSQVIEKLKGDLAILQREKGKLEERNGELEQQNGKLKEDLETEKMEPAWQLKKQKFKERIAELEAQLSQQEKQISQQQEQVNRAKDLFEEVRKYETSYPRYLGYMVDFRLREAIMNMGRKIWARYDEQANTNARVYASRVKAISSQIPKEDGGWKAEIKRPFFLTQTMRSQVMSRAIHGGDLISDCEVLAQQLIDARHGASARDINTLLLLPQPGTPGGETFSTLSIPKNSQPQARTTWQELFDASCDQMYGIQRLQAKYIVECLIEGKRDENRGDKDRIKHRDELMGHVNFIDKWTSVFEKVRDLASHARQHSTWNELDPNWAQEWEKLRETMTNQLFGLKNGAQWVLRPGFHDYVKLFAQACQLYNSQFQTAENWSKELQRLDEERWDVYRLAIGTWKHNDVGAGDPHNYIKDAQTNKRVWNPQIPKVPLVVNLWKEYNWIYQHDLWKHAQRRDPQQPPGAPGLAQDLQNIQNLRSLSYSLPCGSDNKKGRLLWDQQKRKDIVDFRD